MSDRTVSAQVDMSQAQGSYGVSLSSDGFSSSYQFFGTPDEIRNLLADIEHQLADCEASNAEMMAMSEAAHHAAAEHLRHCDRQPY